MSFKSIEMGKLIGEELKLRFPTLTYVESYDTNGDICLSLGSGVAGTTNFIVRVKAIDWALAKDVLGLAETVYTPHVIQICTELNPAGGAGADVIALGDFVKFSASIFKRGTRIEWYASANGVAPTVAALVAGNLKASVEANPYQGMRASQ